MISYYEALQFIFDFMATRSLKAEKVSVLDSVGRVCSADVPARIDNPPFDNSAMDGFAVRLSDFKAGRLPEPFSLPLSGTLAAGQSAEGLELNGGCWEVMTGAPLPAGTDAIVPIEEVKAGDHKVVFSSLPKAGQHIRSAGEDFRSGSVLVQKGRRLTPLHILPLAAAGVSDIQVFKKPKILFLATGAEIIDQPETALKKGQIYNSNQPYAHAFLEALGAEVQTAGSLGDDPAAFSKELAKGQSEGFDIVVSSGAVSAGKYDFVKEALTAGGGQILYHKVRIKPGKPNLLARLPSGIPYFGLPGNPIATAAGLRFFVREAIRILLQEPQERPIYALSAANLPKKPGLHLILKSALEYDIDGRAEFRVLDGQESFKTRPFLDMNGWAHIPEDHGEIKKGDVFKVYPAI